MVAVVDNRDVTIGHESGGDDELQSGDVVGDDQVHAVVPVHGEVLPELGNA